MDIRSAPSKNDFCGKPVPKPREPPMLHNRMYATQQNIFTATASSKTTSFEPIRYQPIYTETISTKFIPTESIPYKSIQTKLSTKPPLPMEVGQSLRTTELQQ